VPTTVRRPDYVDCRFADLWVADLSVADLRFADLVEPTAAAPSCEYTDRWLYGNRKWINSLLTFGSVVVNTK